MSLVGTRPPTVDEWEQYELHHRSRVLPTFSMVLIKLFPFKPNTHAIRTIKYFSSVWLTASSPSSFV